LDFGLLRKRSRLRVVDYIKYDIFRRPATSARKCFDFSETKGNEKGLPECWALFELFVMFEPQLGPGDVPAEAKINLAAAQLSKTEL